MNNQKIIQEILLEKSKVLKKFLKSQNKLLSQAKKRSDEAWSMKGNAAEGRIKKDSMVESSNYTIGYVSALNDLIPEVVALLGKTEKQIKKMISAQKKEEKKAKKSKIQNIKLQLADSKIIRMQELHEKSCPDFGTSKPWAIDKSCTCAGASGVRKRMKKGDSLQQAKKYVQARSLEAMF